MLDISVIIPFKDKAVMTIDCLRTLNRFGGKIKEVLLVSNNSTNNELALVREAAGDFSNTKVLVYDQPFNYQKINNWAAKQATGKVLFLLNNDIELVEQSKGLLRAMYERALEPANGAVGCVLVYEDGDIVQHAGVYLVAGGTADHLYIGKSLKKLLSKTEHNPKLVNISQDQEFSAVTAAAVMVETKKYKQVNGLNEAFIICGGDVDLCLRLKENGYRALLTGATNGYMIHKESKSRSMLAVPYIDFVESYKSYSKHFSIERGDPFVSQEELEYAK